MALLRASADRSLCSAVGALCLDTEHVGLRVLKQGEGDLPFQQALIEDQTKQMMSYPEFLTHCHRFVLSRVA